MISKFAARCPKEFVCFDRLYVYQVTFDPFLIYFELIGLILIQQWSIFTQSRQLITRSESKQITNLGSLAAKN